MLRCLRAAEPPFFIVPYHTLSSSLSLLLALLFHSVIYQQHHPLGLLLSLQSCLLPFPLLQARLSLSPDCSLGNIMYINISDIYSFPFLLFKQIVCLAGWSPVLGIIVGLGRSFLGFGDQGRRMRRTCTRSGRKNKYRRTRAKRKVTSMCARKSLPLSVSIFSESKSFPKVNHPVQKSLAPVSHHPFAFYCRRVWASTQCRSRMAGQDGGSVKSNY